MPRAGRAIAAVIVLTGLAACSKPAGEAAVANSAGAAPDSPPAPTAINQAAAATLPPPAAPQNSNDPAAFVPLGSAEVKDAIHRALQTGRTQRWQDGTLSGYAVPSRTPDARGCRAVRYTVDQRPGAPFETITACDASR